MDAVHNQAPWVVEGNAPARALYRGLGFTPTGSTEAYPNDVAQTEIELSLPLARESLQSKLQ